MLKCTRCKAEKPEDDFRWQYKAKGVRQDWCKSCFSLHEKKTWRSNPELRKRNHENNKARGRRNLQFVWDYLSQHPCVECGETDPVVLEFDHLDGTVKRGAISDMTRKSFAIETLKEEIGKCVVLCANCHRRRTAKQQDWYKGIVRYVESCEA